MLSLVGFPASVRLGKGRADILHDRVATKNRHQSRLLVPALASVNTRRWALFTSGCPYISTAICLTACYCSFGLKEMFFLLIYIILYGNKSQIEHYRSNTLCDATTKNCSKRCKFLFVNCFLTF